MNDGENTQLQEKLFAACQSGNLEQVRDCVGEGCDTAGVFDGICSYLSISVYEGHRDIVQYRLR